MMMSLCKLSHYNLTVGLSTTSHHSFGSLHFPIWLLQSCLSLLRTNSAGIQLQPGTSYIQPPNIWKNSIFFKTTASIDLLLGPTLQSALLHQYPALASPECSTRQHSPLWPARFKQTRFIIWSKHIWTDIEPEISSKRGNFGSRNSVCVSWHF